MHTKIPDALCVCIALILVDTIRCLEDEMNGKHERMKLVARQSQLLSSITELAVSLRRPPQDVVPALFLRLDVSRHSSSSGPLPLTSHERKIPPEKAHTCEV